MIDHIENLAAWLHAGGFAPNVSEAIRRACDTINTRNNDTTDSTKG